MPARLRYAAGLGRYDAAGSARRCARCQLYAALPGIVERGARYTSHFRMRVALSPRARKVFA